MENRSHVEASSESFFTSIGVSEAAPNETSVFDIVSNSVGTKLSADDDEDEYDERAKVAGLGAVKASEVEAKRAMTETAAIFMVG